MTTEAFVLKKHGVSKDAFEKREITLPALKPGEVMIESEAFGLNYADVMARRGLYREAPPMPCVVGYEVVGKVIEVADAEHASSVGKRVVAFTRFGGYAKHAATVFDGVQEIGDAPVSDALSIATQGVTAYYMAHYVSTIHPGDKVLIHAAAGGVGSLLIQLAKNAGAIVFAKVGSEAKGKQCLALGADYAIDYSKSDYAEQILAILKNDRLDISFNPVAGSTFKKDLKLLGNASKIVVFGGSELSGGKFGIFSKLNFVRKMGFFTPIIFMMKSRSIIGVNMLKVADHKPHVLNTCLKNVFKMYEEGKLKPVSGGEFTEDTFFEAHDLLESGKSSGKLIVKW